MYRFNRVFMFSGLLETYNFNTEINRSDYSSEIRPLFNPKRALQIYQKDPQLHKTFSYEDLRLNRLSSTKTFG